MRTAAICPTCATFFNAACIVYDGDLLNNLDVAPLDTLDIILGKINTALEPQSGHGTPISNVVYVGQFYIDLDVPALWVGLAVGIPDWGYFGSVITTTTTTTTP
jgi:hypothetical protein